MRLLNDYKNINYNFKGDDKWCINDNNVFLNGTHVFSKYHVELHDLLHEYVDGLFTTYNNRANIGEYSARRTLECLMELITPSIVFEMRVKQANETCRFNPLISDINRNIHFGPVDCTYDNIVIRPEFMDVIMNGGAVPHFRGMIAWLYDHSLCWFADKGDEYEQTVDLVKRIGRNLSDSRAVSFIYDRPEVLSYDDIIEDEEILVWALERMIDKRSAGLHVDMDDVIYGLFQHIKNVNVIARYLDLLHRNSRLIEIKEQIMNIIAHLKCVDKSDETLYNNAKRILDALEPLDIIKNNKRDISSAVMLVRLGNKELPSCIKCLLILLESGKRRLNLTRHNFLEGLNDLVDDMTDPKVAAANEIGLTTSRSSKLS